MKPLQRQIVDEAMRQAQKYCHQQCELLQTIEDLAKQECEMCERDSCKDQIITVCKVSLANPGMWVQDHYFSAEYAHADWHRLQIFFQLPGQIFWRRDQVEVELKRFNVASIETWKCSVPMSPKHNRFCPVDVVCCPRYKVLVFSISMRRSGWWRETLVKRI